MRREKQQSHRYHPFEKPVKIMGTLRSAERLQAIC